MATRYEVEITITSAKALKNINWRYGPLKPYAVIWVDPNAKCSTKVDDCGDTCPYWDEKLVVPLNASIDDSTLHVDVVHAVSPEEDTKPLIGSARLPLREVVDDVGFDQHIFRNLDLRRPSGRPQGKLELKVSVRQLRYRSPDPYYPPPQPYGAAPADCPSPPQYGYLPYKAPPYGQPAYRQASYGRQPEEPKKSKFGGMGTGLAVGAVAGVLGGLALAEGVDYIEEEIADRAAEKVEEDLGYDDDC